MTSLSIVSRRPIGELIAAFLPVEERTNVGLVREAFNKAAKAREEADTRVHKAILSNISPDRKAIIMTEHGPPRVNLTDENGRCEIQFLKVFGKGISKTAIDIGNGRAVLLPYMNFNYPFKTLAAFWQNTMREESSVEALFRSHGLLTSTPKPVQLSLTQDTSHRTMPAYVAESFDHLKTKGIFVLEPQRNSSPWQLGEKFLFSSDEERLKVENWDQVLAPLLTDLAKISFHRLPVKDNLNMAVIEKSSKSDKPEYQIRYFGFDFQWCKEELDARKKAGPELEHADDALIEKEVSSYLSKCLQAIFICEFDWERPGNSIRTIHSQKDALQEQLLSRYSKAILERMQKMRADV